MNLFKNILIFILSMGTAAFFVYASFGFEVSSSHSGVTQGQTGSIQKQGIQISVDDKGVESIQYKKYNQTSSSGIVFLDFGRLASAFVLDHSDLELTASGKHSLSFSNFQGIVSLYDPFATYTLTPKTGEYQLHQITNGSFYVGNETDGTVSVYSIDAVVELAFFDQQERMTDMILFPGMYIRFDPTSNKELKGADLFRITVVLTDEQTQKNTGIGFINPRLSSSAEKEDIFYIPNLPKTKALFQMLHILFRERIRQVDMIKSYTNTINHVQISSSIDTIANPNKKNFYLLSGLNLVLSKAVSSQMEPTVFRSEIDAIYKQSRDLVEGNSVQMTLEKFLTDARFAIFGNVQNKNFENIYKEAASILKISPEGGKGVLFQYLSDIYSKNIITQKRDPTFSGIDTYTPTIQGLKKTLDNTNIASKDFFDIALYAYQIFQIPAQKDRQILESEPLNSSATYDLIDTIFGATEKYVQGLPDFDAQKSAYQALVIKFYAPIANTIFRSFSNMYFEHDESGRIFMNKKYLDGDVVTLSPEMQKNIAKVYRILESSYEKITPLYAEGDQKSALISFRNSIIRIQGFMNMIAEGKYKEYKKTPYIGSTDAFGIFVPNLNANGGIEIYDPYVLQTTIAQEETPLSTSLLGGTGSKETIFSPPALQGSGELLPVSQ